MTATDRAGDIANLAAIPWWPGESRLATTIRRSRLTLKNTRDELVRGQTKYRDWSLKDQHWVRDGAGDYTFGGMLSTPGPGDYSVFLWNPPVIGGVTDEQGFTQKLVNEEVTTLDYAWPAVLTDLQIIVETTKAGGGDTNNTPVSRGLWHDAQRVPYEGAQAAVGE
jgi:hypothetical protein